MPQLDLEHLGASGHGESRCERECETAAAPAAPGSDHAGAVERGGTDVSASARADGGDVVDAPAESVLLPVRDGTHLAELFGAALRRDGSTKGSSNPKAAAEAEAATRKQGAPSRAAADSTRRLVAAASKTAGAGAVVIGVLPAAGKVVVAKEPRRAAPGRVAVATTRAWRRPAAGARVFASEAVGPEPVSPKVSCFGAVLPETRAAAAAAPGSGKREDEEEERGGCWASMSAALRALCCDCNGDPREGESGASESCSKGAAPESRAAAAVAVMSPPRPVAGLGDVKRIASRRWPETMGAEGRGPV